MRRVLLTHIIDDARLANNVGTDLVGILLRSICDKGGYKFAECLQLSHRTFIEVQAIRQSGIINDVCQENSPENLSRKENIEELVNGMSDFCAQRQEEGNPNVLLGDFLSEVSLLTDQDSDKDGDDEEITLMTVHSAKGLEFKPYANGSQSTVHKLTLCPVAAAMIFPTVVSPIPRAG